VFPFRSGVRPTRYDFRAMISDIATAENFSENSTVQVDRDQDDLPLPDFLTRTENGAVAYNPESFDTLVKLFYITPDTNRHKIVKILEDSWVVGNKLNTLKLIFFTGHARVGKKDNRSFMVMLVWLFENHFETLLSNLDCIGEMSYYKNLLELMVLILHPTRIDLCKVSMLGNERAFDNDSENGTEKERNDKDWRRKNRKLAFAEELGVDLSVIYGPHGKSTPTWKDIETKKKWETYCAKQQELFRQIEQKNTLERAVFVKEFLSNKRVENASSSYELLQTRVIDLFATQIIKVVIDEDAVLPLGPEKASLLTPGHLCAKWFPNRNGRHDKILKIHSKIVKKISDQLQELWCTPVEKREVLKIIATLRKAANVPECYIGGQEWDKINVKSLPGRCRLLYGHSVFKKNVPNYLESLEHLKNGTKINVGGTLPHELMCKAVTLYAASMHALESNGEKKNDERDASDASDDESEPDWTPSWEYASSQLSTNILRWKDALSYSAEERELLGRECEVMWSKKLQELCKGRSFKGLCMADVSGSMYGTPFKVAISLGIAISSMQPIGSSFRNKVLTFEEKPQIVTLDEPVKLAEAAVKLKDASWGGSTDLEAALELFLELAKTENDSPSVLVIVSDMQFNMARENSAIPWETTYEGMLRRFDECNVQIPLIIFWNVRATDSLPVQSGTVRGVVLLSGFSETLLESVFDPNIVDRTPQKEMQKYLDNPALQGLRLSELDSD
jgi:Mg-chelatase subunit ChlD